MPALYVCINTEVDRPYQRHRLRRPLTERGHETYSGEEPRGGERDCSEALIMASCAKWRLITFVLRKRPQQRLASFIAAPTYTCVSITEMQYI